MALAGLHITEHRFVINAHYQENPMQPSKHHIIYRASPVLKELGCDHVI